MDNTYYIREIRRIYAEYEQETARLEKDRKVMEGLMGFGNGLGSAPCHDLFLERLEQTLGLFAANAPTDPEVYEVLDFIYNAPVKNKANAQAFWMMQGVHSLTEMLIGYLTPADAARLYARYKEAYPKSTRLPTQKKIAALLQSQSGESATKRSFWDFIKRRD